MDNYNSADFSSNYRCVLNTYRMTTHSGPGIRTLVQFKGCPLRCLWCSTPESQNAAPEVALFPDKCIRCGKCAATCPAKALRLENDSIRINRSLCNNCGKCADVCHSEAIKLLGQSMTVFELLEEIKRDTVFYKHSGGGVTLSGGEPLLEQDFTMRLLRVLHKEEISIGVDTSGYVPTETIEQMLPLVDFFLWDIKHMDPNTHKDLTGVSNTLILNNARIVSERNVPIYIRVPLITGYNDSEDNITAVCEFARGLTSLVSVDLIPLHHLGKARYDSLNRTYHIDKVLPVTGNTLQQLKYMIQSHGLKCNIVI